MLVSVTRRQGLRTDILSSDRGGCAFLIKVKGTETFFLMVKVNSRSYLLTSSCLVLTSTARQSKSEKNQTLIITASNPLQHFF